MKVNQNISAVISNAHLHRTENKLTASIERLSSGYKLNKAKDSPAGMAISNKMRAQIMALDQSSRNAADGTSVMQTADGALGETHAMLQRMRELSVQAATDLMSVSDKEACQSEIKALQEEIDRIATDTEFNGKRILDGSQDYRVYPSVGGELAGTYIRNFQTSDEVSAENYKFDITRVPAQATMDLEVKPPQTPGTSQIVKINDCAVEILDTDMPDDIYVKLKDIGEQGGIKVEKHADPVNFPDTYVLTTFDYGKSAKIACSIDDVFIPADPAEPKKPAEGSDAVIKLIKDTDIKATVNGKDIPYGEGFSNTATYLSEGKKVMIRDLNGFEMIFEIDPEMDTANVMKDKLQNNPPLTVDLEMTDIGSMTLQVGAHENQVVDVRIPAVTCEALYIDDLDIVRKGGAQKAMKALDDAIAQVSKVRSRIGAYQNRLDYAVKSLEGTEENMEAAISRVMDTDMAEEMATYSNMNVLDQAAISVLTQANDMPQQVLQLLK